MVIINLREMINYAGYGNNGVVLWCCAGILVVQYTIGWNQYIIERPLTYSLVYDNDSDNKITFIGHTKNIKISNIPVVDVTIMSIMFVIDIRGYPRSY